MFEITSILVSADQNVRVESASNADYIWLDSGGKFYAVIVVPHDYKQRVRIYMCIQNDRAAILKLHNSYPVQLSKVRSYLHSIRDQLRKLDESELKQTLITEIGMAFPEFSSESEVERFVDDNWSWLQPFIAQDEQCCDE